VDANTATELARYGMGARLRDIAETDDGAIWVIGDGPRGKLLKLTPKS
jgi:glucose/arabinose dehydrogenase